MLKADGIETEQSSGLKKVGNMGMIDMLKGRNMKSADMVFFFVALVVGHVTWLVRDHHSIVVLKMY